MKKIPLYLASSNRGKFVEIEAVLKKAQLPFELFSSDAAGGMPAVDENAPDYLGNARLKAEALRKVLPGDAWFLAEDSGLEVDALDGAPGVYTARYGSPGSSSSDKCAQLLAELGGHPDAARTARFVCVMVLLAKANVYSFHGECSGILARSLSGEQGFGYDPIFIPEGYTETLAELGPRVKNTISHRARALESLSAELSSLSKPQ